MDFKKLHEFHFYILKAHYLNAHFSSSFMCVFIIAIQSQQNINKSDSHSIHICHRSIFPYFLMINFKICCQSALINHIHSYLIPYDKNLRLLLRHFVWSRHNISYFALIHTENTIMNLNGVNLNGVNSVRNFNLGTQKRNLLSLVPSLLVLECRLFQH